LVLFHRAETVARDFLHLLLELLLVTPVVVVVLCKAPLMLVERQLTVAVVVKVPLVLHLLEPLTRAVAEVVL
jgi:hypothetical protein